MPMPWFRMYHESRNDRKLDTLADDEFRVWHRLLCFASESAERGVIAAEDRMVLAIECARGDEELLARTLARLVKLRIVVDEETSITFVNFVKRNYDKPSDTPSATRERKARQREKARDTGVTETPSRDVTPRHAIEESRSEESRVDQKRVDESVGVATPRRAQRATPAPDDFPITPAMQQWADEHAPGVDVQAETQRFLDRNRAKGETYKDWVAAWRNWLTSPYAKAPAQERPQLNGVPVSIKTANNIRALQEAKW